MTPKSHATAQSDATGNELEEVRNCARAIKDYLFHHNSEAEWDDLKVGIPFSLDIILKADAALRNDGSIYVKRQGVRNLLVYESE